MSVQTMVLFGAVLLFGGGALWYHTTGISISLPESLPAASIVQNEVQPAPLPTNEDGTYVGSLYDLTQAGGSYACDMTVTTKDADAVGTAYVADGNIHARFTVEIPGFGSTEAYMTALPDMVYTWSALMPIGFKTARTADNTLDMLAFAQGGGALDTTESAYTYTCRPWQYDASFFAIPSTIAFQTVTQ